MQDSVNPEGMTFEEWVLAAGVARFGYLNYEGVFPYSESNQEPKPIPGRQQLVNGIIIPVFETVRSSRTFYPRKVRKAWRDGEDPTEWRRLHPNVRPS